MIKLIAQSIVELFLKLFNFLSIKRVDKIKHKPTSYALDLTDSHDTSNQKDKTHPDQSGFYLLENNIDAFAARCNLINHAQHSLDLQYYYFHGDTSGKLIAQSLIKAADRGVRVRVLLDDIDTLGADEAISILNAHPSVEIRIFNPFNFRGLLRYFEFIVDLSRVGRRLHNKAIIADNELAIIGGRNISDVYFSADPDVLFLDVDLLSKGNIVRKVSASFDEYWNSRWAVPVALLYSRPKRDLALKKIKTFLQKHAHEIRQIDYIQYAQDSKLAKEEFYFNLPYIWSKADLFYDHPDKINPETSPEEKLIISQVKSKLHDILSMATEELTIISPYFVPGDDGVKWFETLARQGVKVNVFTNSLAATDVTAVHAGYAKYREQLLHAGVNLYELKASAYVKERKRFEILKTGSRTSLHAKTVIVDKNKVFMGSPNLDPRSKELNTEMGLFIDCKELANQFVNVFTGISSGANSYHLTLKKNSLVGESEIIWNCLEDGVVTTYDTDPETGWLRKLKVRFFSLLPLENLL